MKKFKEWWDGDGVFIFICVAAFGLSLLLARILVEVWY